MYIDGYNNRDKWYDSLEVFKNMFSADVIPNGWSYV